jgi:hypothetical protein
MADIIDFPENPNKFGITPTIAQAIIADGYNPNQLHDVKNWLKDMEDDPNGAI